MSLPGPAELEELVKEAYEKLKRTPKLVEVEARWPILVVGDIHGDMDTLERITGSSDFDEAVRKGIVVFLGDYIDRGPRQVEVITAVLQLKLENSNVYLLRGNHEPPEELKPYPHDFPHVLREAYGDKGRELYTLFLKLFSELPYALIVKGYALMVHGGPPVWVVEDRYRGLRDTLTPDDHSMLEILEQVLWNDPTEGVEYWAPSPRGAGVLWGVRVTEATLEKGGVKLIVRGHEPADEGYKLNHRGKVLTLFSRLGPPYFNAKAAYLYWEKECAKLTNCIRQLG